MKGMIAIPEGVSGNWLVERFTVSRDAARLDAVRGMMHGWRCVPAGTYTALKCGGTVVMSDTPDELRDLSEMRYQSRSGHILIAGLGLGCAVQYALGNPEVDLVTVIEISNDVIRLVGPTLRKRYGKRLEIIQADALDWLPPKGVRYRVAWFDIWNSICGDNVAEMTKLKRRFGRLADWKGCWCEHIMRRDNKAWE